MSLGRVQARVAILAALSVFLAVPFLRAQPSEDESASQTDKSSSGRRTSDTSGAEGGDAQSGASESGASSENGSEATDSQGAAPQDSGGTPQPTEEGQDASAASSSEEGAGSGNTSGEVPLPSFLDTTDRRIVDERPPPSPEQVAALREMEKEVERFQLVGQSYRATVVSLVRREYLRQRRGRDQWYGRQIRDEERMLNEARANAIRQFERFIERYPDDPTYTPDAMFRLGELYFERSAVQFQEQYDAAQAARDRGDEDVELPETPDYLPTIELYKRLVRNFPDYRRIDGVLYLIGYCLNEMGEIDEAREAWLALACANKHKYDASEKVPDEAELAGEGTEDGDSEKEADHPALELDKEEEEVAATGPFVDPYRDCKPVQEDARFVSETWFRIGEYHFDDYGSPHALDLAISAYNRILTEPEDRNYNLALYKVAWAYYRASRYPEAIKHFGMLVQWSDDERQRTGKAGSELRPEAIQYLGIAFAYDDWNENQVPDPIEGQQTGIERIQSPNLLPQDRPWTPDVYFQLGQVYFDEAKYPEAIAVWRLALEKWPNHRMAPEITNLVARAHQRHNEFEDAIAARSELARFTEGGDWWNANVDNPKEQRRAEQLAENALIATAIHHHTEAQKLRSQCVAEQDVSKCRLAQEQYGLAAAAYRGYLERYPNNPQAYELRYNLADALYWSENYEEAAKEYAAVRDSNLDDAHLAESARRVVESMKRIVDAAVERGEITVRNEPPAVSGTPPTVRPTEMPQLVQRLARAREMYIARVSEEQDSENVREAYDYNNALLLYWYGYWPQAKKRFERIFDERCTGRYADETGRVAWLNLREMAVRLQNNDELERLAAELQKRKCTFSSDENAAAEVDCSQPENAEHPFCLVQGDLNAIQYRRAIEVYKKAEGASGDEQRRLYERAATMLVKAVNENPNDPQAPVALEWAATALERTSRFESAATLYQRIVNEVGPRRAGSAEEQARLDAILANAYFRLAFNANRFFDFDRAVENYRVLADTDRFEKSGDAKVQEKREDALINAAIILERLQRYDQATRYYRRAYSSVSDPAIKRRALYRIGEIAYKQKNWSRTVREMRNFIKKYGGDSSAGELVVLAHWRIAQARKADRQVRDYPKALEAVTQAFSRSGQAAGSIAAEYAAEARFRLVDPEIKSFERFSIKPGRPADMKAYVRTVTSQIESGARQAQTLSDGYSPVLAYRRPTWTIASFVRQGRVYEILARAVLNAPFVMPADMQRQLRRVGPDAREDVRIQVEDQIRQVLDERVRPIECLAVARYALAARAAQAGSIDDEYTRVAIDRLQAYGDERIAECIAEAQRADSSFKAYRAGEFTRAPRGQVMTIRPGTGAPPLASGGRR